MSQMKVSEIRHNAETALINALAMLRNGDTAQALTLAVVAVGRIGSLVPSKTLQQVGCDIADKISAVRTASPNG